MKAVVVEQTGGPEVLTLAEWPAPQPGPGQLLVQVAAAGVNFMDVYQRQGLGSYRTDPPFVPGAEGAGTVVAVGDPGDADGTGPTVGDLVAWAGVGRSYAAQAVVPADRAVRVPAGVDARVAAAVMLQGLTAHYLCTSTYVVRPGDVTVVHAAAGGLGLLLTQMIKQQGGVVIGTTSGGTASPRHLGAARRGQRAGAAV